MVDVEIGAVNDNNVAGGRIRHLRKAELQQALALPHAPQC
jgi:hypothetical protein